MSNARNLARLLPNASGQLPDAAMSSGSVIQMVQKQVTTRYLTSNSDVYQSATDFNFSITPSRSDSIIVGIYNIGGFCDHVNGGISNLVLRVQRNGSVTVKESVALERQISTGTRTDIYANTSLIFTDAPGTTAATSYTFNYKSNIGNVDYGLNRTWFQDTYNFASHLILLEIAP